MENTQEPGSSTSLPLQLTDVESNFRKDLEDAIEQRSIGYEGVFVLTMYFESDDTNAMVDSKQLAKTMKELGLHDSNILEFSFPDDYDADIYWPHTIVLHVAAAARSFEGRMLFIFHFSGHSSSNKSKEVVLSGTNVHDKFMEVSWTGIDRFLLASDWGSIDLV
ncbi:uncharacterized protein DFL_003717 [Arthrobotrys flagrans]|uniref:Uncharacterized protein n=1 Tax=Arthrobotrys flagrans TaxID=97331 RepID=A0A437A2M7_ARTFL|nr:hypothetical protein DFL_003717 [Arthrobotrys flagrans]